MQRAGTQSKEGSPTGGSQPELEKRPLNFLSTARPELIVGDANDPLEREADRIAERVTADGDSPRVTSSVGAEIATPDVGPHVLSRKFAAREHEEKEQQLQRKATLGNAAGQLIPAVVHDVLRSSGQALDAATRASMERRFGHDFGSVRVHADEEAAKLGASAGGIGVYGWPACGVRSGAVCPTFEWRKKTARPSS